MTEVALYLRVSSEEQSVANQLPALEAFARSRGWEIAETYQEAESAWKAGHQRELSKLLADCREQRGKFNVLLVWALDRLSREGAAAILNLIDTFKVYGGSKDKEPRKRTGYLLRYANPKLRAKYGK